MPEIVVVDPLPVEVMPPGDLVTVHVPDEGNPLKGTLPVANVQEGWVTVPTAGGEGTGFIVIVMVVARAHCPAEGVNVYVVVTVLFIEGLQVPETPFKEVEGNAGIEAPAQKGPTLLNDGSVLGVIVIVRLAVEAHWPELGVNVYVVVALLFIAGLQVPLMPFVDVVGRAGIEVPAQYGPAELKEGVTTGLIVIVSVVVAAHCPAEGVNVYVVVALLFIAGLQVPIMPLVDVVGKAGIEDPAQYGPAELKAGVIIGLTVIVSVVVTAHCPAEGVNVYVVVAVLLIAGLQVPLMPFVEVVGRAGIEAPEQNGPAELKAGVTTGLIVIVSVVVTAHCPADGVNVYVVVTVLLITGLQVPVMPFKDVMGSAGIEAPAQYGPAELNAGTVFGVIIIVKEAVVAHWPELGVNV